MWLFIERTAELADDVVSLDDCCIFSEYLILTIVFESRLDAHNKGNDCLMSIDGTEFRIEQQGPSVRGNPFGSHKYAGKSICGQVRAPL